MMAWQPQTGFQAGLQPCLWRTAFDMWESDLSVHGEGLKNIAETTVNCQGAMAPGFFKVWPQNINTSMSEVRWKTQDYGARPAILYILEQWIKLIILFLRKMSQRAVEKNPKSIKCLIIVVSMVIYKHLTHLEGLAKISLDLFQCLVVKKYTHTTHPSTPVKTKTKNPPVKMLSGYSA